MSATVPLGRIRHVGCQAIVTGGTGELIRVHFSASPSKMFVGFVLQY